MRLPTAKQLRGFDCGPANVLLDEWVRRHKGRPYDDGGRFAQSGTVNQPLLNALLAEPFFEQAPPKSTGRDLFNAPWLDAKLAGFERLDPADVQATLAALTAVSIAREIERCARLPGGVYLRGRRSQPRIAESARASARSKRRERRTGDDDRGARRTAASRQSLAFAWLAMRCSARRAIFPQLRARPANASRRDSPR